MRKEKKRWWKEETAAKLYFQGKARENEANRKDSKPKDSKPTRTPCWTSNEKKHRAVILKGEICAGCGQRYEDCVFDFHHIIPRKEKREALKRQKWEVIQEELKKCVMLCSNCHRLVHHGSGGGLKIS